jgi:endo-1,4-beta-D-glucanase Y
LQGATEDGVAVPSTSELDVAFHHPFIIRVYSLHLNAARWHSAVRGDWTRLVLRMSDAKVFRREATRPLAAKRELSKQVIDDE